MNGRPTAAAAGKIDVGSVGAQDDLAEAAAIPPNKVICRCFSRSWT